MFIVAIISEICIFVRAAFISPCRDWYKEKRLSTLSARSASLSSACFTYEQMSSIQRVNCKQMQNPHHNLQPHLEIEVLFIKKRGKKKKNFSDTLALPS